MPRIARVVATGLAHHVTQRGNHQANVFFDEEDRTIYLRLLRHYSKKHRLEILAYCLMPNHIHLVAIPHAASSLARTLAEAHMRHAQHINRKLKQTGHLWQGRFYSCVLDEAHALAATRYVERNPVRAGLAANAWDFRWSSASVHIGERQDELISKRWPSGQLLEQWRDILGEVDEDARTETIRVSTRRGRPLGSEMFVEMVKKMTGHPLKPKQLGRPPKGKKMKRLSKEIRGLSP